MSDVNQDDTEQNYKKNKIMTLVGCVLINFASGIIPVWGNANLYFLSYFKNNGQTIDKDTNSWILISTVVPMCIFVVFSAKLSKRFGYLTFIKICAYIFFISQLVVYFRYTKITCTIFLMIIPITTITMSFVPLFNSLWTYYQRTKNKVTGFVLVIYGLGGIVFNILFLHLVNPSNLKANKQDGDFTYFDQQVSDNLEFSTKAIYLMASVLFVVGSLLVRRQGDQQNQGTSQKNEKHFQLREEPEFNIEEENREHGKHTNEHQMIDFNGGSPCQISSVKNNQDQNANSQIQLKKYLFDWKFIIIFCNVLFIDFYASYILNNFKLIYIQSINDDHFLGYCLVANTVTALIGTFIWGLLGDKFGFGKTCLIIVAVDLLIKIVGIFSQTKPTLFILMFFLGFTSRGLSTISGPGLVQVFGLKIATQLLPIKALAVIGSFVLVPIIQLIFLNFLTYFQLMNILICINFFILASTLYFLKHFKPSQQKDNVNWPK